MSERKHDFVEHDVRTVDVAGRSYSVNFDKSGTPCCVRVHANSRPGGYCIALRRIPIDGPAGRAAIAKATGVQP